MKFNVIVDDGYILEMSELYEEGLSNNENISTYLNSINYDLSSLMKVNPFNNSNNYIDIAIKSYYVAEAIKYSHYFLFPKNRNIIISEYKANCVRYVSMLLMKTMPIYKLRFANLADLNYAIRNFDYLFPLYTIMLKSTKTSEYMEVKNFIKNNITGTSRPDTELFLNEIYSMFNELFSNKDNASSLVSGEDNTCFLIDTKRPFVYRTESLTMAYILAYHLRYSSDIANHTNASVGIIFEDGVNYKVKCIWPASVYPILEENHIKTRNEKYIVD